jgi:hypothetical protein
MRFTEESEEVPIIAPGKESDSGFRKGRFWVQGSKFRVQRIK